MRRRGGDRGARLRRLAASATAAAALLGGCGGIKAPDLFIVERAGAVAGARLTLVVNEEGGVRCNGGRTLKLTDAHLVEARAIQEDLHALASRNATLATGPRSVFAYYVREESGAVRFSDTSPGQPHVLRQLALFVLQTAQQVCHLPL